MDTDDDARPALTADEVAERLALAPHPEGGAFRETWRDDPGDDRRGAGTAILYLLRDGEVSHWHRVDAAEVWHFHDGAALELRRAPDERTPPTTARLGVDLVAGDEPQLVVPVGWWQSARSTGAWTLVSCTVSPAFEFAGFELASDGFVPGA